ncbi:MAG: preprotein translocase subunit SecG [Sodalis sp. (in: enterobacteria)]
MYQALLVMFLLVAFGLIASIMLQQGKSSDMAASFGAGVSSNLFGSRNSGNFMIRITAVLATLFFVLSLVLDNLSSNNSQKDSQGDDLNQSQQVHKLPAQAPEKPNNDIPK